MSAATYEWEAMPELGPAHEWEGEYEFEDGLSLGMPSGASVLRQAARAALEALGESEWEGEGEWEDELNPVRKVYPDAALEHLAHAAMNAESEAEAGEAFLPLIPMVASRLLPLAARALPHVARALPRVASAVSRVTPQLTRGVARIAGRLYRNPQTRALLRTMPSIARRTVGVLARRAAHGQPITPRVAVRTLARQAAGVLSSPHHVRGALRRSRVLDRVYHRGMDPALVGARPAVPAISSRPAWVGPPAAAPSARLCAACGGSRAAAPAVVSPPAWVGPPVAGPGPVAAGIPPYAAPVASLAAAGYRCQCPCPCCGR
jgi:hypothetical protein